MRLRFVRWRGAGVVLALGSALACSSAVRTGTPPPACAGPYCQISCTTNDACPTGSWCENGQCTTGSSGVCDADPDGDGYCTCCAKGADCPGGEGNPIVYPGAPETCDGLDNDCDGRIDGQGCTVDEIGVGGEQPFGAGQASGGVIENPDGSLSLGSTHVATDFAWPSNDVEGTISRIDTIRNVEVGRYPTVLFRPGGNPADPGSPPPVAEWNSGCNRPSRTTVDLQGNAYVANRAHQEGCAVQQGSVTKIGFFDEALCALSLELCACRDRNGNGTIETSRDLNGDGRIALTPLGEEYLAYDDECLLWTVPIGASNSIARAMAIDADGYVWVGDWQGRAFFKLDPADGRQVNPSDPALPPPAGGVSVSGQPYGAVIDSRGTLWYVNTYDTGTIQSLDTRTGVVGTVNADNPTGGYGITIDRKDRVWLASYDDDLGGGTVTRYDPTASDWQAFSAGLSGSFRGRGITATPAGKTESGAGIVYAAFHNSGGSFLVGFEDDTGAVVDSVNLTERCGAATGIGVGIGTAESLWVVNQDSDDVCRYDPETDEVVNIPIGNAPYTYSDFTGNVLRSFTSPQGTYRQVVGGCPPSALGVLWSMVVWEAATPGGSSVEVRARAAASVGELATAPWQGPAIQPPARSLDLGALGLTGDVLEVQVTLKADDSGNVPTLYSLSVGRVCLEDEN